MKNRIVFFTFSLLFVLGSCSETTINDAEKAFEHWIGTNSPNTEVNVIHGRYWKSGHFFLEFEAMFKMTASSVWINQLIDFNKLTPFKKNADYINNNSFPSWFTPNQDYKIYSNENELYLWTKQGSDTIYIYNLQL